MTEILAYTIFITHAYFPAVSWFDLFISSTESKYYSSYNVYLQLNRVLGIITYNKFLTIHKYNALFSGILKIYV